MKTVTHALDRLLVPLATLALVGVPGASAQAEEQMIEEIVVTAQKRAQSLQDVPVAVTAFTGDDVRELRLLEPRDVAAQTPNLDIKHTLGATQPIVTIRGVGLNDFVANNSQSAGVYLDEVYLVSPAQMSFQIFDTERIEVLKGPQGTLYGRNTTAGAVKFITVKPSQEVDAYGEMTAGNYGLFDFEGAVGGGLSDAVAGRLSFKTTQRSKGWIDDRATGEDNYGEVERYSTRGQLLFTPTDTAEILLSAYYGRDKSDAMTMWKSRGILDYVNGIVDPDTGFPLCQAFVETGISEPSQGCTDLIGYADPYADDPYTGEWGRDPGLDIETYGVALTVNWDFEAFTLTSVTAADKFERVVEEDADGSPFAGLDVDYHNDIEQWSQELRLASNGAGNLEWILGAFYSHDKIDGLPSQDFDASDWFLTTVQTNWTQKTDAFALFGQSTYHFSEQWALTAGLRYTDEQRKFTATSTDLNPDGASCLLDLFCNPGFVGPFVLASTDDKISYDKVTGEVTLDWTPVDQVMFYGKVSTGFKSGGFPGGFTLSDEELLPYKPEQLTAYEIGTKTRFAGDRVQLNGAVFYYDYKDIQVLLLPPGEITTRLANADKAEITGAEAELWVRPAAGLDLKLGVAYLDTENKDPQFDGNRLPNAPEYTFNGLVRYEFPLSGNLIAAAMLDFNYVDDTSRCAEDFVACRADDYTLVNGRLSLGAADGRWEVSLWGQNLGDEEYQAEIFQQFSIANYITLWGAPRTYGATLRVAL